jgi:hypothetical protein
MVLERNGYGAREEEIRCFRAADMVEADSQQDHCAALT